MILATAVAAVLPLLAGAAAPKPKEAEKKKDLWSADTFTGLGFRSLGPAVTSGRVGDIAVHPSRPATWYVAVASGGVWKTVNAGTTWTPVFDAQGSYSIGCVTLDPKDPLTVWVGTGENNSQRSVAYGDGIYRSTDGGKSWENLGLKSTEHISKIVVDPRDSKVVYAAAQGPLWSSGGERGLYKTLDGGKTWTQSLKINDDTGVTDVWMDPRDADVLYAAAYQRRRHVWTLIDGGPDSAIHKSKDAGATWKKLENGLPKGDKGRIGLAVSSVEPDTVYAIVEATGKEGGFFRSTDAGGNWEKMGDYMTTSPQYYNEIIPDPRKADRVYAMDTWMHVTDDGGKTFRKVGEKAKHVDNHALWIDPGDTTHLVSGCDGGVYESFDRGATWAFKANLPITQFYRVAVDEARPFYNVYGGTQDNNTLGGPSRTVSASGITNADWFVTVGGDGFTPAVDPTNPDIVYSQSQHGNLVRFDKKTGEKIDIQPHPAPGEPALRYNWDSPLLVSPHSPTRLYFAAQRLFRSDDRGDSWRPVSPDLTAQIDRNKLKVMGRVQSVDAVAKSASTSFYGNIVSLAESPKQEGLLYVGTDDGLVQVSDDGGTAWRRVDRFPGVPPQAYVSDLEASPHDAGTVYAAFDHHKMGDFKPYLLKSADRGRTWVGIAGDLPARGTVYTVAEDPEKPNLLFAGTEFGVFFSADGGKKWVQLKGGIPTIAVRDLAIQKREGDLVLATFGRGFYVLDDLTPLRRATPEGLAQEAALAPVKDAWMFIPSQPLGLDGQAFMGDAFYTASNPPFGAVFTYYLKDEVLSRRKKRQETEKKVREAGGEVAYPTWDELRAEDRDEDPEMVLTVTDEAGRVVRRLSGPVTTGFHRLAWDLRYPPANPTDLKPPVTDNPFADRPLGPLSMPGSYRVSLARRVNGKLETLGEPQPFHAVTLGAASLPAPDRAALLEFQRRTGRLQGAVLGAVESADEAQKRIDHLKKAFVDTPGADPALGDEARSLEARLKDLRLALDGDPTVQKRNEPVPPSVVDRVQSVVNGHWNATSAPTATHRTSYAAAAGAFGPVLEKLKALVETDLRLLEDKAEKAGAPWTPGRVPRWSAEAP